jgi:stage IV sporulation protein FA
LFFGVAILYRVDLNVMDKPKQWTASALTEEFPFATVNQWYQEKFGYPLALTPKPGNQEASEANALPVNGTVSESFQSNGQGIMITTDEKAKVSSMKGGTVIFAGNDPETKKTVIIQHADRSKSIYGHLSSIQVHQYQFVGDNEVIGGFVPSRENAQNVYFAIQKNNKFLDPIQVMKVDERP